MLKLLGFLAFLLSLCLLSSSAGAVSFAPAIDFRDDGLWSDADGRADFSGSQAGIGLTLFADPGAATLWQDDEDGIGIRRAYEDDEIEGDEILLVEFLRRIDLSAIYVADLFTEDGYDEIGRYRINGGDWVEFDAGSLPGTGENGEHVIEFDSPILLVDTIEFSSLGSIGGENHEFSLMGFDAKPSPLVPEPGTAALLGLGLLGLAAPRRLR